MRLADLHHQARRAGVLIGLAGATLLAGQAHAQEKAHTSIHPYLEVQQVFSDDFSASGDVLTYTSVGAGIDASVSTRRVHATVNYNYQHQFNWDSNAHDADIHQGLAAARLEVVPGTLAFDAGGIATRTNGDIHTAVPPVTVSSNHHLADVYSLYAGPTLTTHAGQLEVDASYHLGYVEVDDNSLAGTTTVSGQPRIAHNSNSTVQQADASVGMSPGPLPFGWTIGAGWGHEDMNHFDSKYEGKYVRADIVVPVGAHFALAGGLGYEDIHASQQDLLRDAGGVPIVSPSGEVTADPSKPRITTYDQDGEIWDVGLIWRPSPRTEAQARYGRRYGSDTFTGSFRTQISHDYGFSAVVFDNVSSFGRSMIADLGGVPRNFNIRRNPFFEGVGPGGCIFGTDPGTGTCFDNALQSVANFNFRNRGASATLSGGHGPWNFSLGASYVNRRYLAPDRSGFTLDGVTDESFSLDALASRQLTPTSGFDIEGFAGWYQSGLANQSDDFTSGITLSYYRSLLGEHFQGTIAAGLYTTNAGSDDSTVGSLLLGLRYTF